MTEPTYEELKAQLASTILFFHCIDCALVSGISLPVSPGLVEKGNGRFS